MKWIGTLIVGVPLLSLATGAPQPDQTQPQIGYLDCRSNNGSDSVLAFEDFCGGHASTQLKCGSKVRVLKRVGPWLDIVPGNDKEHFVAGSSVATASGEPFVTHEPAEVVPDCGAEWSRISGKQPPRILFTPDPGYTKQAREAHLQGIVLVSLVLGVDGQVHDVKVQKGLGRGLDEKAIEVVQEWRFRPALENGHPVSSKLNVEVSFRLLR
jgi:TonB family protein